MSKFQISNFKYQISGLKRHLIFVICYSTFLILAFALRLAPLGRYVTPDEPAWVYRSIRFADALSSGDWSAVPVTGHPGATTMWLGALGVQAARLLHPAESSVHLDFLRRLAWLSPESGVVYPHLAYFLPWGRATVALFTALGLALLYPLLTRLLDRHASLVAIGLLAFDRFDFFAPERGSENRYTEHQSEQHNPIHANPVPPF